MEAAAARLLGEWKVDADSPEVRESVRRSATSMTAALRLIAGDSGTQGNYDVERFVENTLATMRALELHFTSDSIVVSHLDEMKRLEYRVLDLKGDSIVLRTTGNGGVVPSGIMMVRFIGDDELEVRGANGPAVSFMLHKMREEVATGARASARSL